MALTAPRDDGTPQGRIGALYRFIENAKKEITETRGLVPKVRKQREASKPRPLTTVPAALTWPELEIGMYVSVRGERGTFKIDKLSDEGHRIVGAYGGPPNRGCFRSFAFDDRVMFRAAKPKAAK